jgi:intracellular sulfur oxidation DsrE/DsrF family protein
MPDTGPVSPVARRSFLSRLGAGVTVLGAAFIGRESVAEAQPARTGPWQPTRHAQDDWLDQLPGQHRFVFAYADAMWAKYGAVLGDRSNFDDPLTTKRPVINVFNSAAHGASLSTRGTTLDGLAKRGVHFAVCQMATRFYAGSIATTIGGTAEDVYTELVSNLVPNAHMAPAGIVAVNRAQERGYAFVNAG